MEAVRENSKIREKAIRLIFYYNSFIAFQRSKAFCLMGGEIRVPDESCTDEKPVEDIKPCGMLPCIVTKSANDAELPQKFNNNLGCPLFKVEHS